MVKRKNKAGIILLFLLPGLLLYIVLVLAPIIQGFILSLYKWSTLHSSHFVGFDNYIAMFQNQIFRTSFKNSCIFMVVTTAAQVILGFLFGYFLSLHLKGYRFYKTVYFIPAVLATVAVGFIWGQIYSPVYGFIRPLMKSMGLGHLYTAPLANGTSALYAVIIVQVWGHLGVQIMMFYSGFMNIPQDVIEMARIDGAKGYKMIIHMILPLSWETTKTVIILQLIANLRAFDLIFIMTKGGPYHATEVLPMHLYLEAFQNIRIGEGSAVGVVIFVLCFLITVLTRKLMAREVIQY